MGKIIRTLVSVHLSLNVSLEMRKMVSGGDLNPRISLQ